MYTINALHDGWFLERPHYLLVITSDPIMPTALQNQESKQIRRLAFDLDGAHPLRELPCGDEATILSPELFHTYSLSAVLCNMSEWEEPEPVLCAVYRQVVDAIKLVRLDLPTFEAPRTIDVSLDVHTLIADAAAKQAEVPKYPRRRLKNIAHKYSAQIAAWELVLHRIYWQLRTHFEQHPDCESLLVVRGEIQR